jgi:hypothetical protein
VRVQNRFLEGTVELYPTVTAIEDDDPQSWIDLVQDVHQLGKL